MANVIENQSFDQERALYGTEFTEIRHCHFGGPADGESALKESHDIIVADSDFQMRYVLWHVTNYRLERIAMDSSTRAALWYDRSGRINDSKLHGIKVLRECVDTRLERCDISSEEFGWKCDDLKLFDCTLESVYPFLMTRGLDIANLKMKAKYSFQYVQHADIENCQLDTKDAFWHSKDVTVRNSTITSEYLGWYSENLTLVNCHIKGTQPFCYCKNLTLIDCTMEDCDLAFEYSSVNAKVKGRIESIKNPLSGRIEVDAVGEIIRDGSVKECKGEIFVGGVAR